ncbi:MAG TPA: hypothetical protein VJI70_01565 [Candidatus Paceibacterota bacterium]
MRPLPETTGVGVGDEGTVKEWVKLAVERMMEEPVAHGGLMDIAGLGVRNFEMVISSVPIGAGDEFAMKCECVRCQIALKFLHVRTLALAARKLFPRLKKILKRDDILIDKIP